MPDKKPSAAKLLTARRIADEIDAPLSRVLRVLDKLRDEIPPAAYAANTRLYRRSAVAQVRREIERWKETLEIDDSMLEAIRELEGDDAGASTEADGDENNAKTARQPIELKNWPFKDSLKRSVDPLREKFGDAAVRQALQSLATVLRAVSAEPLPKFVDRFQGQLHRLQQVKELMLKTDEYLEWRQQSRAAKLKASAQGNASTRTTTEDGAK